MAGKRKQTHWAVRRKDKKARGDDGEDRRREQEERVDRRAGFPEAIHPGSYAALRPPVAASGDAVEAKDNTASLPPKRRFGIWLAFCGKKYSGMQMNEGVKTIEAELERALFEAGGISQANYGFLQKIGWSRAARTDKGVHAAGQLLTAKLHVGEDVPAFVASVNAALPEDIRVMSMVTVTKNFNAKMSCDQRTYEYLAPTFIFAPRTRSAASTATDGETKAVPAATLWPTNLYDEPKPSNDNEEDDDEEEDKRNALLAPASLVIDSATAESNKKFRMPDDTWTKLNEVLKRYEGTHNFHNFTSKLEPTSPKCNRFILSFEADKPFVNNDMEWVRLRVVGQSFLLHQIRKMVGTAVEIVAGVTTPETIAAAMQLDKMDLPKAPSVGLYLAQAHFQVYNRKMQDSIQTTHPALDLEDPTVAAAVEQFKQDFIFSHIMQHEDATQTYAKWLRTLDLLPLDYVAQPYAQWKQSKEDWAALTDRAGKREAAKAARLAVMEPTAEPAAEPAAEPVAVVPEPDQSSSETAE